MAWLKERALEATGPARIRRLDAPDHLTSHAALKHEGTLNGPDLVAHGNCFIDGLARFGDLAGSWYHQLQMERSQYQGGARSNWGVPIVQRYQAENAVEFWRNFGEILAKTRTFYDFSKPAKNLKLLICIGLWRSGEV